MFQPQDEEKHFKVGDNTTVISHTSDEIYWNRPLAPGEQYQVTLVALNWQDGEYEYSVAKLQYPVQTLSASNPEEKGGTGSGWAALLLLLIIPAAAYFIVRLVMYKYRLTCLC
jgi:hypothetical protein